MRRERAHADRLTLDPYTRGHLEEMIGRLTRALEAGFRIGE